MFLFNFFKKRNIPYDTKKYLDCKKPLIVYALRNLIIYTVLIYMNYTKKIKTEFLIKLYILY